MRWLALLLFVPATCWGQFFTDSDLPIVVINTNMQPIPDDPRIVAHMGIIYNGPGNRNYMTDPFNNYDGNISIERRGSTSQQYPKKSYGLETQDSLGQNLNVPLLGMPSEQDWILYAPYPDKTMMRNVLTYDVFRRMGHWSPRTRFCELVVNNVYEGVYVLIEKIKRDPNRLDIGHLTVADTAGIPLTGGYVMKVDKGTGSGDDSIPSAYSNKVIFQFHDPAYAELHSTQQDYMTTLISDFEDALAGPNFTDPTIGWRQYIDQYSFIDFFLMQELGRPVDGYRSSSFFYKPNHMYNVLMKAGPMWDFNLSYGNADYCDAYLTTGWQYNFASVCPWFDTEPPFWWAKLLQDPTYVWRMKCRWTELRQSPLHTDSLDAFVDSVALVLDESQQRNFQRWPILGQYVPWNYFVGNTYQEEINYLKSWMQTRAVWMDNNLPGSCVTATAELQSDIKIEGYPNPTSDNLFLNAQVEEVRVYDCYGRYLYSENNTKTIDLSSYPAGVYLLRVEGAKQAAQLRVVKQ